MMKDANSYIRYNEIRAVNIKLWGDRERALAKIIRRYLPVKRGLMLEAGAGDGFLLDYLKGHTFNFKYNAVDISTTRTRRIANNVPFCNVVMADITALPYQDNTFDVVICSETLEHIPDYNRAISELFRVAQIGASVIILVPNQEQLITIECPHCGKEFFQWGHIHSFSANNLRNSIVKCGGSGLLLKELYPVSTTKAAIIHYCRLIFSLVTGTLYYKRPPFLLCSSIKT
jgi:ubiquinone/menaquinone biosynthesis C-methylase UbiE